MTNIDSYSMFFVFICSLDCPVNKESEFRKIMFEILKEAKIAPTTFGNNLVNMMKIPKKFWDYVR